MRNTSFLRLWRGHEFDTSHTVIAKVEILYLSVEIINK